MAIAAAKVVGVNRVRVNLLAFGAKGRVAAQAAINKEALELLSDAKEIVPIDEGILRSTGRVRGIKRSGEAAAEVVFGGGPAADYAVVQHEDLDLQHAPGKKPKYLEGPALERLRGMAARIEKTMRSIIGS